MEKYDINFDKQTGIAKATINYNGVEFITHAFCHPDDMDVVSEFVGCEIATRRANIKVLQHIKNQEIKPEIRALKHLKSLQEAHGETIFEKSYLITLRELLRLENELNTIKEMIATEKQGLKEYINAQEEISQIIRHKREKAQNNQ